MDMANSGFEIKVKCLEMNICQEVRYIVSVGELILLFKVRQTFIVAFSCKNRF